MSDIYYTRGLDGYLRDHFRGAAGFKARGEATPSYLASGRKARDRIGATWARTYDSW